ncbi:MAG: bifunctional nuclease family protein, partial [Bacteroidales bacterium]|nr:bifunctional nuclease family protein [Bacteroidales bacterium]
VFYAKLICLQGENESEIDARTSDAVALAIRFRCPIYTNENIMSEAGIVMDDKAEEMQNEDNETTDTDSGTEEFTTNTMEELEEMLQKAISNEEYEKASKIRDEITKRTKN